MRVGFTGAHRTGKTTLAKSVSEITKSPYIESPAGAVALEMGINLKAEIPFEHRIAYQTVVLQRMVDQLSSKTSFVTDRTPLDAAAYLLADCGNATGTPKQRSQVALYVENCLAQTAKLFDVIIYVPPAIPYYREANKPPFNEAYQEHHGFLVNGMFHDDEMQVKNRIVIERKLADHKQRVDAILEELSLIANGASL